MEDLNLNELSLEEVTLELKGSKTTCCACGATVGTFTWVGDDRYKCRECLRARRDPSTAKSTFPFTTSNIVTGQTIEVQSLRHLRKLENEHGVQSIAYNQNHNNMDR